MDVRYWATIKAMALVGLRPGDMTTDDLEFLQSDSLWLATERNRARRAIEAVAYAGLDVIGIPRIQLPAEFIAAAIVQFVSPANFMLACAVMEGAEWSEAIILEVDKPISGAMLFAHVIRIYGGMENEIETAQRKVGQRVQKNVAVAPAVGR